jgi:hypothetical protein
MGGFHFRFASGFATLRALSTKTCATGLSVRFFSVTIPLGTRAIGSSTGKTLSSGRLMGNLNAEAVKIVRKCPVASSGAGRMRDCGFPIEWGVGRHGAGNNVFAYFAGPEEFPIELTGELLPIDDTYVPHGPDYWRYPPGRLDQWGVTEPHTPRWKRIQDLYGFTPGAFRV